MSEDGLTYLLVEVGQDIGRMESNEGVTDDRGHLVDAAGVGPVRIVNRSKSQSSSLGENQSALPSMGSNVRTHLAFQGGQHHMGRIQAMDEVGWERRSLFH